MVVHNRGQRRRNMHLLAVDASRPVTPRAPNIWHRLLRSHTREGKAWSGAHSLDHSAGHRQIDSSFVEKL